jgi:4-coumarate--CoA ligase
MDIVSWIFAGKGAYAGEQHTKPLLIDADNEERSLSYQQLRLTVRQLVAGLHHEGISPGDCVLINAFNDIYYSALVYSIIGAGAVFTGVNPAYTPDELVHHMELTKPSLIVVEPQLLEKAIEAADSLGIPRDKIFAFDHSSKTVLPNIRSWSELMSHGEKDWETVSDPRRAIAQYASTSGTSGLPKAGQLSHWNHILQADNIASMQVPYEVRRLTPLPPFHSFATPIVPACVRQAVPVYIMRRFHESHFIKYVEKYQITETWLPPPVIVSLPLNPLCTSRAMNSLKQIWSGGASLKYTTCEALYKILSKDALIQPVWGTTETGWITCGTWPTKITDNSVAQLLHGYEIKVVDDNGEQIQDTQLPGELIVKAPAPILGYINNPKADADIFDANGWVCTGDIGFLLGDRVVIIDRKKEIIKVRGWQVSPTEIEAALLQHPDISDAAVIGTALSEGLGEVPKAFVVLKGDKEPTVNTVNQIKLFAEQLLAKYKVPQEIMFIHAIPKNSTGKILRRVLRGQGESMAVKPI